MSRLIRAKDLDPSELHYGVMIDKGEEIKEFYDKASMAERVGEWWEVENVFIREKIPMGDRVLVIFALARTPIDIPLVRVVRR